ncbi:hypothetical protein bcgnr5378_04380 [Bacillus cereus]|uniref:Membrane protein n=7 Tax=Bacillaceae TaxID=186817 RepID=A0AAN0W9N7_BACCE|nr:hypothetical protein [Bacillus cereus]AJG56286.1 putative membrane protein [Bacillus cereus 03BB102]AJG60632.1 putative membrane protein [Bacillus cereus D17]AJH71427.1 putative membrane protein [Bacillus thuringiensis]AJI14338.1 putative membrane protein [Bacillus cereus 03BB108]SMD81546.1 hypothetical protein BACERE00175_01643 [Bacillus cereus]
MFESMYWPMGLSIMFLILFFMGKKKDTALLLFSFYFGSMLIDRLFVIQEAKGTWIHTVWQIFHIVMMLGFTIYVIKDIRKLMKERKLRKTNQQ